MNEKYSLFALTIDLLFSISKYAKCNYDHVSSFITCLYASYESCKFKVEIARGP